MNEKVFPICRDSRKGCNSERNGRCLALTDTVFDKGICPFYKTTEDFLKQLHELEMQGHIVNKGEANE